MKKSELKALIKEVITEVTQPIKVVGKYIYFSDDKELYSLNPYKFLGNQCDITLADSWTKSILMQGEDVKDILKQKVDDLSAWYVVNNAPSDHTFAAYIGK